MDNLTGKEHSLRIRLDRNLETIQKVSDAELRRELARNIPKDQLVLGLDLYGPRGMNERTGTNSLFSELACWSNVEHLLAKPPSVERMLMGDIGPLMIRRDKIVWGYFFTPEGKVRAKLDHAAIDDKHIEGLRIKYAKAIFGDRIPKMVKLSVFLRGNHVSIKLGGFWKPRPTYYVVERLVEEAGL